MNPTADLAARARAAGYVPPPPKYPADHDYRGRGDAPGPDYYQRLLDPERTALLVVDMQNIFVREGAPIYASGADAIVPPINDLARLFRASGLPVIWTVWCQRPDGANGGRNAAYWPGVTPLAQESDLAQIHPSMDVDSQDIVLAKPSYNSFWGTDLEQILRTSGITSLVLTGIATDVCVGTTVIDAYHRDYVCVTVADATATTTPFHEQALWLQENYWGRVLTAAEVSAELTALQA